MNDKYDYLTQDFLKKRFYYNKKTGIVFNRKTNGPRSKVGSKVGSIHPERTRHRTKYLQVGINYHTYLLHRVIWIYYYGYLPKDKLTDHIDGDGLNNKINNLRLVDAKESMKNGRRPKNNTSGVCGVIFRHKNKKWEAFIKVNRQFIFLGTFIHKRSAIRARKKAEIKYRFHKNHGRD